MKYLKLFEDLDEFEEEPWEDEEEDIKDEKTILLSLFKYLTKHPELVGDKNGHYNNISFNYPDKKGKYFSIDCVEIETIPGDHQSWHYIPIILTNRDDNEKFEFEIHGRDKEILRYYGECLKISKQNLKKTKLKKINKYFGNLE